MILGASYSQLPLYEAARQLGVSTVAASTPGDWPGFAVADESVYADITSPEAILKAAQEKEIDGIATCCLDAVHIHRYSDPEFQCRFDFLP